MIQIINKISWAFATIILLITAIYFSIKLKFPQLRYKKILKSIRPINKNVKISNKNVFYMTLASKIGVGTLSGTALAIYYGGAGTILWIWIITLFVSINCYVENILATKYRKRINSINNGGPSYYIKLGLKKPLLAKVYSIIAIFIYIVCFCSIQSNTIAIISNNVLGISKISISIITCILTYLAIKKNIVRISNICSKIVPVMGMIFILTGLIIIIGNINNIPKITMNIFKEGIYPKSINGGIIYVIIIAMQKTIFATEAGCGTGAIISGSSEEKDPIKQGNIGILSTYFISLIIITITGYIILLTPYKLQLIDIKNGIELTNFAFSYHLKSLGNIVLLITIFMFSFSTLITAYYYGENNLLNIIKSKKAIKCLKIITIIIIITGGIQSPSIIWDLVNISLALITIINTYAVFNLNKEIIDVCKIKT